MTPDITALTTTTADTVRIFAAGNRARNTLNNWRDKAPAPVQELVLHHVTRAAYQLTPADLTTISRTTDHALGNIDKKDHKTCFTMKNYYAPLAWTYAFHYLLEQRGTLFTWQEWLFAYDTDPLIKEFMADPAAEAIATAALIPGEEKSEEAWTWRLGNAYYSFLRELFVLVGARAAGFDVRMHPLADVLFRVDAWTGTAAISLYVPNDAYKSGGHGRKKGPQHFLYDSPLPWTYHHLVLHGTPTRGRVNYPDPAQVIATMNTAVPPHLRRIAA